MKPFGLSLAQKAGSTSICALHCVHTFLCLTEIEPHSGCTTGLCCAPHVQLMSTRKTFEFDNDNLEYHFVEELGRRTLYSGILSRLLLGSSWALGWRKILSVDEGHTVSSLRYADPCTHRHSPLIEAHVSSYKTVPLVQAHCSPCSLVLWGCLPSFVSTYAPAGEEFCQA